MIGTNIKLARREKGIRQKELASRIGRTQAFLSQIENNHRYPSVQVLLKIAHELQVSILPEDMLKSQVVLDKIKGATPMQIKQICDYIDYVMQIDTEEAE